MTRAGKTLLLVLAVAVLGLDRVDAAGTISGEVRDEGGLGIAGVWVDAYDAGTNRVDSGYTASDGSYSITNLPAGSYALRTDSVGANFVDEWYEDVSLDGYAIPAGVTWVAVSAGGTVSGADLVLSEGGGVAGTVTGGGGLPLEYVWVDAYDQDGTRLASGLTESNGTYEIVGIAGGSYYIRTDAYGLNYVDEWYDDVVALDSVPPDEALPLYVAAGWTTNGIDFALATGGTVSGMVEGDGAGLSNVWVDAYTAAGVWFDSAGTDENGDYTLSGIPAGDIYLRTYVGSRNFADEWYDDVPVLGWDVPDAAGALTVSAGSVSTGVDFTLDVGGTIVGTVSNEVAQALGGVRVDVYTEDNLWHRGTTTDLFGSYSLPGLPAAPFYVRTEVGELNYADQWYDGVPVTGSSIPSAATVVTAELGAAVGPVDFVLAAGGTIEGTVTDASAQPLEGVSVDVYDAATGEWVESAPTASNGVYAVSGIPAGTCRVRTYAVPRGYADEWYDGVPVEGGVIPAGAAVLTVVGGATNAGIDFALARGASISGTVYNAGLTPLAGVLVYVRSTNNVTLDVDTTAYDGTYELAALPAGSVYLRTDADGLNVVDEWYDGAAVVGGAIPTGATALALTAGLELAGVDFELAEGGGITGRVTMAGSALDGAAVDVYAAGGQWLDGATTAADGSYELVGLAGPTSVFIRTYVGSGTAVDEWYDDVPVRLAGIPVEAQALSVVPGVVSSVVFELSSGGAVEGRVVDGAGSALTGIGVSVFTPAGVLAGLGSTGAGGLYAVPRLPVGTYYARTYESGDWFVDEWFDDVLPGGAVPDPLAAPVVVGAGTTSAPVDFALGFLVVDTPVDAPRFRMVWQAASGTTYRVRQSYDLGTWLAAPSGTGAVQQATRTAVQQGLEAYESPVVRDVHGYYKVEIVP